MRRARTPHGARQQAWCRLIQISGLDRASLDWRVNSGAVTREPELSRRQRDVLYLIEQGRMSAEIAATLGLNLTTVRMYVGGVVPQWRLIWP